MLRFWPIWVLLAGGLFLWGMQRSDPDRLQSVLVGRPAPTFSLPLLEPYRAQYGSEMGFSSDLGKPVLLNIWASWCIPCHTEAPLLERYHQKYKDRVLFLGVVVQDTEANALKFIQQYRLTFPSVFDKRGRIGIEYGYYGVPETYVIDRDGTILARHAGELSEAQLQGYLRKVLE
ncbi:TlpA disulfide reductase family protein [uncultured Meiothermus sp.]|jgi:cytochrome c biogenesis protein CcmG/thiol:disulfide interchange protein DsbE|uniref:TlpA family protein disulfide reductase n=1 Tax=uncultured Meiothermus sp. TaxID=157471 RepID=UPI00260DD160|nr:TlpA disulfide reductase family protein [uncultured Meiothermus sp.]